MNVNKCPLKYVISLCLTVWAAGALFAQPVVSSSDSAYGRALYKRIMRLNPDSLLRAHADPAVYQRTITAESGSDSIYSREDKRWFYIDRNEFHRVIAAGPSYVPTNTFTPPTKAIFTTCRAKSYYTRPISRSRRPTSTPAMRCATRPTICGCGTTTWAGIPRSGLPSSRPL